MTPKEAINIIEDVTWQDNGRHDGKIAPARESAISALEKQIPKKPKITIYNGYCPQCGEAFGRINIETAALTGFKYFGFCPICGQALDWGDCE